MEREVEGAAETEVVSDTRGKGHLMRERPVEPDCNASKA